MEFVGDYQYRRSDIIGHGAFAVVFRGSSRLVSKFRVFACDSLYGTMITPVNKSGVPRDQFLVLCYSYYINDLPHSVTSTISICR